jgi:hypothetical protein
MVQVTPNSAQSMILIRITLNKEVKIEIRLTYYILCISGEYEYN